MTEHMFFRRLCDLGQGDLYRLTDNAGTELRGSTYDDFLHFDMTVSPAGIQTAFDILYRFFSDFSWSGNEIRAKKEVVLRQIDERYYSFGEEIKRRYYGRKPIMGRATDVRRMSIEAINSFRKKALSPGNCCICVTGNYDEPTLGAYIRRFSEIPARERSQPLSVREIPGFMLRNSSSDRIFDSGCDYSSVSLSFDVGEERYTAEYLYGIIGYGVTSKLSLCLRENRGLIADLDGEFDGKRMTFEFEVGNERLIHAIEAAADVLSVAKGDITDEDVAANRIFYTDNQYRLLDDVRELNDILGWRVFIRNEKIESIGELADKYAESRITTEKIYAAAKEIFRPENLIISVTNNRKIIKSDALKQAFSSFRSRLSCNRQ